MHQDTAATPATDGAHGRVHLARSQEPSLAKRLAPLKGRQEGLYAKAIPYLEAAKRLAPEAFDGQDVLDYARRKIKD